MSWDLFFKYFSFNLLQDQMDFGSFVLVCLNKNAPTRITPMKHSRWTQRYSNAKVDNTAEHGQPLELPNPNFLVQPEDIWFRWWHFLKILSHDEGRVHWNFYNPGKFILIYLIFFWQLLQVDIFTCFLKKIDLHLINFWYNIILFFYFLLQGPNTHSIDCQPSVTK